MDPQFERKEKTKKLNTIIKVLVSLTLILYIVLKKVDKAEFIKNFELLDWRFIPLIFLLIVGHYVVSSFRWKSLLVHEKAKGVPVRYLLSLYFIGAFFNNFMPTSIGGDVYKMYHMAKKVGDPGIGFSSVFTERFTGIVMLALIALLSMTKTLGFGILVLLIWFILGVYIGIFSLKLLSGKIKFLGKVYNALIIYKNYPKVLGFAMLTSIIVQVLSIFVQYFTFMAIGVRIPIFYAFLAFPVITLVGFFIPSLNGFGVQDALYMSTFAIVGVPVTTALSASIIYHISRIGVSLIGGVLYALGKDA
ncbi:MAG: lysylphosphatidylglycerol synthase transmembrane domain-containing protein [Patescibacteria group bacterium]|nr:flippase-like domain-containing protein [Patescibacteria group bacterium]MBU1953042.1 flippase-like domain-containing protein [Patescibacteria group bacterium]